MQIAMMDSNKTAVVKKETRNKVGLHCYYSQVFIYH